MTAKSGHSTPVARWVQQDDGSVEMETQDVVVAMAGDRAYTVPSVCNVLVSNGIADGSDEQRFHVSAEVGVRDGAPHFRHIEVIAYEEIQPIELRHFPWTKVAEAAIVSNASRLQSERVDVIESRTKATNRDRARTGREDTVSPTSGRQKVTDDRLREVATLRAEAEANGLRYDTFVAQRMSYTPAYVRRLAQKARERGF